MTEARRSSVRMGLALAMIAWLMFALSFALPSYEEALGYQCAILQADLWPGAVGGNWGSIHYELLTLANLLMLLSPVLYRPLRRHFKLWQWSCWIAAAAVLLVWGFIGTFLIGGSAEVLRIGAFVWSASFGLLFLAVLFSRPAVVPLQHSP